MYSNPENQRLFREALFHYSSLGWRPIPVVVFQVLTKDGEIKREKAPLVVWQQFQNRGATQEELKTWAENPWSHYAGIELITGSYTPDLHVCVMDFDQCDGKPDLGDFIDETIDVMRTKTASGGFHFFYKSPIPYTNATNIYNKDKKSSDTIVDFRGSGGVIVAGPTPLFDIDPRITGSEPTILARYSTDLTTAPSDLQPFPLAFSSALEASKQISQGKWKEVFSNEKLKSGDHHKFAMSIAGKLLFDVKDEHELLAARYLFSDIMRRKESKPFPEKDAIRMFDYCLKQGEKRRSPEFQNALEIVKKNKKQEREQKALSESRSEWENLKVTRFELLGDVLLAYNNQDQAFQLPADDFFNQKKFRSYHLIHFGADLPPIPQTAFETLLTTIPIDRNTTSDASLTELISSILDGWVDEDELNESEADAIKTARVHSHATYKTDPSSTILLFRLPSLLDALKEEGTNPKRTSVIAALKDLGSSLQRNNKCNLWLYGTNN